VVADEASVDVAGAGLTAEEEEEGVLMA
jgi:hypothetical protein